MMVCFVVPLRDMSVAMRLRFRYAYTTAYEAWKKDAASVTLATLHANGYVEMPFHHLTLRALQHTWLQHDTCAVLYCTPDKRDVLTLKQVDAWVSSVNRAPFDGHAWFQRHVFVHMEDADHAQECATTMRSAVNFVRHSAPAGGVATAVSHDSAAERVDASGTARVHAIGTAAMHDAPAADASPPLPCARTMHHLVPTLPAWLAQVGSASNVCTCRDRPRGGAFATVGQP
jgi:hypothetical protein